MLNMSHTLTPFSPSTEHLGRQRGCATDCLTFKNKNEILHVCRYQLHALINSQYQLNALIISCWSRTRVFSCEFYPLKQVQEAVKLEEICHCLHRLNVRVNSTSCPTIFATVLREHLMIHFCQILKDFQTTYSTLNVRIYVKLQQKITNSIQKFKSTH